jgi:hypothetical protein
MPYSRAIQVTGFNFALGFYCLSVEGEINWHLTLFSDEAWFHLQGYINTQNNRSWNLQNPHVTHEVLLHPVKVGVSFAASTRRIVGPVFL